MLLIKLRGLVGLKLVYVFGIMVAFKQVESGFRRDFAYTSKNK
jgi:hypothetical protein